jgi:hypothetical protein
MENSLCKISQGKLFEFTIGIVAPRTQSVKILLRRKNTVHLLEIFSMPVASAVWAGILHKHFYDAVRTFTRNAGYICVRSVYLCGAVDSKIFHTSYYMSY